MTEAKLGLKESLSIALGGMIGGGIFAVLGVLAQITRAATWFAFILAGIVAICAAYSYTKLNTLSDDKGGSVTFVQCFTGNSTLAGMIGWTLLFGYIGSMAMYAFAFGSYTVGLPFIPDSMANVPLRPVISVLAVGAFVVLNTLGARATGSVETVLVGLKVMVLLMMGLGGLWYGFTHNELELGISQLTQLSIGPLMAGAVSFVAFQGWQLLFYDQESITNPVETIPRAVYISIGTAVGLYVIVAITTLSLAPPDVIQTHPERALAVAAEPFMPYGFLIISMAALFSTGSAINATLFSSGYFAKGMLSDDLLPDRAGDSSASGVPQRTLVLLGAVTAAFTVFGSLNAITSFASLAFLIVFGGMSYLAFRQRNREEVNAVIPTVGMVGTTSFFFMLFWYLYRAERSTFYTVLIIAAVVITVELLYFERNAIKEEITPIEEIVEESIPTGDTSEG